MSSSFGEDAEEGEDPPVLNIDLTANMQNHDDGFPFGDSDRDSIDDMIAAVKDSDIGITGDLGLYGRAERSYQNDVESFPLPSSNLDAQDYGQGAGNGRASGRDLRDLNPGEPPTPDAELFVLDTDEPDSHRVSPASFVERDDLAVGQQPPTQESVAVLRGPLAAQNQESFASVRWPSQDRAVSPELSFRVRGASQVSVARGYVASLGPDGSTGATMVDDAALFHEDWEERAVEREYERRAPPEENGPTEEQEWRIRPHDRPQQNIEYAVGPESSRTTPSSRTHTARTQTARSGINAGPFDEIRVLTRKGSRRPVSMLPHTPHTSGSGRSILRSESQFDTAAGVTDDFVDRDSTGGYEVVSERVFDARVDAESMLAQKAQAAEMEMQLKQALRRHREAVKDTERLEGELMAYKIRELSRIKLAKTDRDMNVSDDHGNREAVLYSEIEDWRERVARNHERMKRRFITRIQGLKQQIQKHEQQKEALSRQIRGLHADLEEDRSAGWKDQAMALRQEKRDLLAVINALKSKLDEGASQHQKNLKKIKDAQQRAAEEKQKAVVRDRKARANYLKSEDGKLLLASKRDLQEKVEALTQLMEEHLEEKMALEEELKALREVPVVRGEDLAAPSPENDALMRPQLAKLEKAYKTIQLQLQHEIKTNQYLKGRATAAEKNAENDRAVAEGASQEISAWKQKCTELEKNLQEVVDEHGDVVRSEAKLREQTFSLMDEIDAMKAHIAAVEVELADKDEEITQCREEIIAASSRREVAELALLDATQDHGAEVAEWQHKLLVAAAECERIKDAARESEILAAERLAAEDERRAAMVAESGSELAEARADIARLREEAQALRATNASVSEKLRRASKELVEEVMRGTSLSRDLDNLKTVKAEADALAAKLASRDATISALESQAIASEAEVQRMRMETSAAGAMVAKERAALAENETLQHEIVLLKERLQSREETEDLIQQKVLLLEGELSAARAALEILTEEVAVARVDDQKESAKHEIARLENRVREETGARRAAENELEATGLELSKALDDEKAKRKEAESEVLELAKALATAQKEGEPREDAATDVELAAALEDEKAKRRAAEAEVVELAKALAAAQKAGVTSDDASALEDERAKRQAAEAEVVQLASALAAPRKDADDDNVANSLRKHAASLREERDEAQRTLEAEVKRRKLAEADVEAAHKEIASLKESLEELEGADLLIDDDILDLLP